MGDKKRQRANGPIPTIDSTGSVVLDGDAGQQSLALRFKEALPFMETAMLVLGRAKDQKLVLGDDIIITVIAGSHVRLGIEGRVKVRRAEVLSSEEMEAVELAAAEGNKAFE